MRYFTQRRQFKDLTEQEVLALAISSEEDDGQIYRNYAERLRSEFPDSAKIFDGMAVEEDGHRASLIAMHRKRFGEVIPLIRREHVAGYYARRPVWLIETLGLERIRDEAAAMESDAEQFYLTAAKHSTDAETRKLLGDLAAAEAGHHHKAETLTNTHLTEDARAEEDRSAHRKFVLTWVQPGLAGLMDGSVSTLAPIFATAFATQNTWTTFLVGLAASVGAGISMGFTEAASDDGELSGRGSPLKRGIASGVMTTVGGLGHALPYLIPSFWTATTLACIIVFIELWAIAWLQKRYMQTPFLRAAFQVVVWGALVFAACVLIGRGYQYSSRAVQRILDLVLPLPDRAGKPCRNQSPIDGRFGHGTR
jgi:rubrerythrin